MVRFPRIRSLFLSAIVVAVGPISVARADWVTIKNDTKRTIVVQSAVTVNGQVKRGKPVRLLPGEVMREFYQPSAVGVEVYDAQMPNKPILNAPLTIKAENQAFSVAPAAAGAGVVVSPADPPAKK